MALYAVIGVQAALGAVSSLLTAEHIALRALVVTSVLAATVIVVPPLTDVLRRRREQDAEHDRAVEAHHEFARRQQDEHFGPRGRGVLPQSLREGWYFTGRVRLLEELTTWLSGQGPHGSDDWRARVVTGSPGAGKSAVLGRLLWLTDPGAGGKPLTVGFPESSGALLPEGTVQIAVHARARTADEVAAEVGAGLGLSETTAFGLLARLRSERINPGVRIIVDAVDEASDPRSMVMDLLEPLVSGASLTGMRTVIGTRRGPGAELLRLLGPGVVVLDLDSEDYSDPDALAAYVERILLAEDDPEVMTPYRDRPTAVRALARVIATRADGNYLVAQLTALSLALSPQAIEEVTDAVVEGFPVTVGAAMERYLRDASQKGPGIRDYLVPLAWAEGEGIEGLTVWAAVASALGTEERHEADIVRAVLDSPVCDLLQISGTPQRRRYRLFHQALSEHLRELSVRHRTEEDIQVIMVKALSGAVPRDDDGSPRWAEANGYTRMYLAVHGAAAGTVDDLLADAGYLSVAEPARLLVALSGAHSSRARGRAALVKSVGRQLLTCPTVEQVSYLELAARMGGDDAFADEFAALERRRPWRVPWARWTLPSHPSRIIGQHDDEIHSLSLVRMDGEPIVVSGSAWTVASHRLDGPRTPFPVWRERRDPILRMVAVNVAGHIVAMTLHQSGVLRRVALTGAGSVVEVLSSGHDVVPGHPDRGLWPTRFEGQDWAVTTKDEERVVLSSVSGTASHEFSFPPDVNQVLDVLPPKAGSVRCAGTYVLGRNDHGVLSVWDLESGLLVGSPLRPDDRPHEDRPLNRIEIAGFLDLDDVLRVLLVLCTLGRRQRTEIIWTPVSGDIRFTGLPAAQMDIIAVRGLPLSNRWCYADCIGNVHIREETSKEVRSSDIHDSIIRCLVTVGPEERVVSGGHDGTVRVWSPDGAFTASGLSRNIPVAGPVRHGPHPVLVCGRPDGGLDLVDVVTGAIRGQSLPSAIGPILTVTVAPDGKSVLLVGNHDPGVVRRTDGLTGMPGQEIFRVEPGGWVSTLATLEELELLVVGTGDGLLHMIGTHTWTPLHPEIVAHEGPFDTAMAAAGDRIFLATWDCSDNAQRYTRWAIRLTDCGTGAERLGEVEYGEDKESILASCVVSDAGCAFFVTVGWGGRVRVWGETGRGSLTDVRLPSSLRKSLNAVAVVPVPGGQLIVCGGFESTLLVWHPGLESPPGIQLGTAIHDIIPVDDGIVVKGSRGLVKLEINPSLFKGAENPTANLR